MKRVLVVAYYFPPIAASGSMRPLGFCRYLEEYGWNPRVLTTSPGSLVPPQRGDETLGKMVPPHLMVDVVSHGNPLHAAHRLRRRLSKAVVERFVRRRSAEPHAVCHGPEDRRATFLSGMKDLILDSAFAFPDRQCRWYAPAVRKVSRLPRGERPDVVLATGGPWTGLLVGKRLAERFGVPLVADFRDPWTMNPYARVPPWLASRARHLERRVVAVASRIVANTEELRGGLCAAYPEIHDRCVTITNGFDDDVVIADASSDASECAAGTRRPGPRVELAHFGSVYGLRNPRPLFQSSLELVQEGRIRPENLRLRFVGAWDVVDEGCEALARDLERLGVVSREAPMSRAVCLEEMSRSPCLLALQGESPLQVPGKIYEYVATRRPILLVGGEGATARLIQANHLGTCWPNRSESIKDRLAALVAGRTTIEAPPPTNVKRFHYRALTGRLADVLDAAVSRASSPLLQRR